MNIFKDFENDLVLTIIIPKGSNRDAVKIFNEYDKTGTMLKGKSSDFLLDLILESCIILGNPFIGIGAVLFVVAVFVGLLNLILGDIGVVIARILILGLPIYMLFSHIFLKIKRKRVMEMK